MSKAKDILREAQIRQEQNAIKAWREYDQATQGGRSWSWVREPDMPRPASMRVENNRGRNTDPYGNRGGGRRNSGFSSQFRSKENLKPIVIRSPTTTKNELKAAEQELLNKADAELRQVRVEEEWVIAGLTLESPRGDSAPWVFKVTPNVESVSYAAKKLGLGFRSLVEERIVEIVKEAIRTKYAPQMPTLKRYRIELEKR